MSLVKLLSKLELYSESDSHQQVLETGLAVLKKDPLNVNALRQSLVALINLENYSEAVKLLQKQTKISDDASLLLEKAYVFYKLNDFNGLQSLIKQHPSIEDSTGFQHILAQYYYRAGKSEDALKIYQKLAKENKFKSEQLDISVNERAVISQLKFQSNGANDTIKPVSQENPNSYDLLFNDALIKIRDHDFENALKLLKLALAKATVQLSEYDEEERISELTPIQIQIAYVNQLLNRPEEALSILEGVSSVKDSIFKLLITNNLLSLKDLSDSNPALLYRHLEFPNSLSAKVLNKLTLPQIEILQRNEILLAYKSGKNYIEQTW
ncbi:unnamed protein product [Ambrosiozyma monospora]|uniref:Unnamed protein product n=1 Tax=Ambrosiozyma monospora TaxID=43982 RepID=A0ACB5T3R6_AMBMO|nr:unnamed protein product [Ambrosiozyma monospora]